MERKHASSSRLSAELQSLSLQRADVLACGRVMQLSDEQAAQALIRLKIDGRQIATERQAVTWQASWQNESRLSAATRVIQEAIRQTI